MGKTYSDEWHGPDYKEQMDENDCLSIIEQESGPIQWLAEDLLYARAEAAKYKTALEKIAGEYPRTSWAVRTANKALKDE